MGTQHLTTNEFFSRLSSLFNSRRNSTHGSIFLTQKRLTPQSSTTFSPSNSGPVSLFPDLTLSSPLPVLIRATNGKSKEFRKNKIKLSTIVQPDQLEEFFTKYAEVMKAGTTALKKRDRSGRKKAKAKKKLKAGEPEKK